MAKGDPVRDAVERWHEEGILDEHQYEVLRARADEDAKARSRSVASLFMLGAGAILLVIAFIVLATIFWDDLTEGARALILWLVTGGVLAVGILGPRTRLGVNAAPWLLLATIPLTMLAVMLTDVWLSPDGMVGPHPLVATTVWLGGALIVGLVAFTIRTTAIVPVGAFMLLFAYIPFGTAMYEVEDIDAMLWTLDGIAMGVLLGFAAWRAAHPTTPEPFAPFIRTGALWVGFLALVPLVPLTWFGLLEMDSAWGPITIYALLALAALVYGILLEENGALILGSLLLIGDAWYFGVTQGEEFGTFLALLFSAGVLFWLGSRLGIGPLKRTPSSTEP